MKNIAKLFDYFKLAFHLNKQNKRLYLPQIVLILLQVVLYLALGVFLYKLAVSFGDRGFVKEVLWDSFINLAWWIGIVIVLSLIASIVIESGLYNMYSRCIKEGQLEEGAFSQGVSKYFLKFLLADILMLILWVIILIPYIIIGLLSLLTGFILIPLLISVFTIMWKVSMVVEDVAVIEGFRRGFRFAKKNFIPLSFLVMIMGAFTSQGGGGSFSTNSRNGDSSNDISTLKEKLPGDIDFPNIPFPESYMEALPYIKMGFYILIPVVGVAIIVNSLVLMIFKIFFGLSTFIMYIDSTKDIKDEVTLEVE